MTALFPLFVASYGRSGSTLLMRALQAHPQIILRNFFPYETRFAQYGFIAGERLLALPATVEDAGIIYHPFPPEDEASRRWLNTRLNMPVTGHGLEPSREYYHTVQQWHGKPAAQWFAEKSIGLHLLRRLLAQWPAAAIGLLRDPRDTFVSVKFFNRKRGFLSFGEEEGEHELFRQIIIFHKAWRNLAEEFPDRLLTIRYEELVNTPMSVFNEIADLLKISKEEKILEEMHMAAILKDDAVLRHRSSAGSMADSIGRWRQDASPEHHSLFAQHRQALQELGYE